MRNQIFICYSHADSEYQCRLKVHLASFERRNLIQLWTDNNLRAGDSWVEKIEEEIDKAAIAILLISADFLYSEFIANKELPRILEAWEKNEVRILPVMVHYCAYEHIEPLANIQFANDPNRPLSIMDVNEREKVWADLSREIYIQLKKEKDKQKNNQEIGLETQYEEDDFFLEPIDYFFEEDIFNFNSED